MYNVIRNSQERSKETRIVLSEERLDEITRIVNERGSITNQELVQLIGVSESTIRRDITALAEDNRIIRVHGGAMSLNSGVSMEDSDINARREQCGEEKKQIAKYAASLINNNDLVYIDAGTTTEYMIDYITAMGATFVTNALSHAVQLAKRGFNVYIIGGQIKSITEAIIDSEAIISLTKYNFTKGFFGTNGISRDRGLTTPDVREADIKKFAMSRCAKKYVLCDSSKFNKISKATFAMPDEVTVITESIPDNFRDYKIKEADEL